MAHTCRVDTYTRGLRPQCDLAIRNPFPTASAGRGIVSPIRCRSFRLSRSQRSSVWLAAAFQATRRRLVDRLALWRARMPLAGPSDWENQALRSSELDHLVLSLFPLACHSVQMVLSNPERSPARRHNAREPRNRSVFTAKLRCPSRKQRNEQLTERHRIVAGLVEARACDSHPFLMCMLQPRQRRLVGNGGAPLAPPDESR